MRHYNRMNISYDFYAGIAREHYSKVISNSKELEELNNKIVDEDTYYQHTEECIKKENELQKNCIITITFSAMSLESFIYDYSASVLGDSYTSNYIDKLDVISKWVIVPKMITGKEIPRDERCFELLKQTIKLRNNFIHSKSKEFNLEKAVAQLESSDIEQMVLHAKDSVDVITKLAIEIDKIDPEANAKFKLDCDND